MSPLTKSHWVNIGYAVYVESQCRLKDDWRRSLRLIWGMLYEGGEVFLNLLASSWISFRSFGRLPYLWLCSPAQGERERYWRHYDASLCSYCMSFFIFVSIFPSTRPVLIWSALMPASKSSWCIEFAVIWTNCLMNEVGLTQWLGSLTHLSIAALFFPAVTVAC